MKFNYLLLCLLFPVSLFAHYRNQSELPIVLISASYKNADWYKWNLDSVFSQDYTNWRMIYIDDCSPDNTGQLVNAYVKERGFEDKVTVISNQARRGAMANQYFAIHSCDPREIIVILDGDDRLAHTRVLSRVNEIYSDENTWLTYGQFIEYPSGQIGFCVPMPKHIVAQNAFREFGEHAGECIPSHLRTFYAGLFHKIKIEDLICNGKFWQMCPDIAAMFPMIEMARDHFKFVPDILLEYNAVNPLNEHKISKELQRSIDIKIRALPRYDKVSSPF